MPTIGLTVARRVESGWECVDDAGRRVVVPLSAIDPDLRALRVGQRLVAESDAGAIVRAVLP
ncbi:MAG: hypothetical protein Q4F65_10705 [Propionibacteriaceae bacterium]|nr:hypothetical protein [Propionibacteriaceae bacterium]